MHVLKTTLGGAEPDRYSVKVFLSQPNMFITAQLLYVPAHLYSDTAITAVIVHRYHCSDSPIRGPLPYYGERPIVWTYDLTIFGTIGSEFGILTSVDLSYGTLLTSRDLLC